MLYGMCTTWWLWLSHVSKAVLSERVNALKQEVSEYIVLIITAATMPSWFIACMHGKASSACYSSVAAHVIRKCVRTASGAWFKVA